jgi:hypothetical protein
MSQIFACTAVPTTKTSIAINIAVLMVLVDFTIFRPMKKYFKTLAECISENVWQWVANTERNF